MSPRLILGTLFLACSTILKPEVPWVRWGLSGRSRLLKEGTCRLNLWPVAACACILPPGGARMWRHFITPSLLQWIEVSLPWVVSKCDFAISTRKRNLHTIHLLLFACRELCWLRPYLQHRHMSKNSNSQPVDRYPFLMALELADELVITDWQNAS